MAKFSNVSESFVVKSGINNGQYCVLDVSCWSFRTKKYLKAIKRIIVNPGNPTGYKDKDLIEVFNVPSEMMVKINDMVQRLDGGEFSYKIPELNFKWANGKLDMCFITRHIVGE